MDYRFMKGLGFAAVCAGIFFSCQSSPRSAFPTAQTIARSSAARGTDLAMLAQGRKIFTTSCTECHVARPIAGYSVTQWRHNVSVMAPRARLKPGDRAALEAYLVAARESLPQS
ncbi:MAG: hypothetical protein H0X34_01620 [Chthoniobacterales bacterium]|nr:hypothetical protein [Chthoniobacterales bacterium]